MIFENVELHNVSAVTADADGGYILHRFPLHVEARLSEKGISANTVTTGVEIRFKMRGERAVIRLAALSGTSFAYIYRGGIHAGDGDCVRLINGGEYNEIVVKPHASVIALDTITHAARYPYSPDVVRVIFSSTRIKLYGIDGDVVPPSPEDLPSRTYLAYGSSITHGSMAIGMTENFVSRVGAYFRADVRNLGLAGACLLESAVADEIAEMGMRGEWDFATLCLGINRLRTPREEIRALVDYMIGTIAGKNPTKHIFCISPMYSNTDFGDVLADIWREEIRRSVRRYGSPYVHYVSGISLIGRMDGLSGDLVHPSPDGVRMISERLVRIMRRFIK